MGPNLQFPDAQDGRTGSLIEFFKAQPAKYWLSALIWCAGLLIGTVGAGFAVGQWTARLDSANEITRKQSELDHRNALAAGTQAAQIAESNARCESRLASSTSTLRTEVTDLKVQNAALAAKVEATQAALGKRDAELLIAQNSSRALAESVGAAQRTLVTERAEHNRKVDALKGCRDYNAKIENAQASIRELKLEQSAIQSSGKQNYVRLAQIKVELEASNSTLEANGQMFMASCNTKS